MKSFLDKRVPGSSLYVAGAVDGHITVFTDKSELEKRMCV